MNLTNRQLEALQNPCLKAEDVTRDTYYRDHPNGFRSGLTVNFP